ncbi:MAG TPA: hypothetical protein VGQ34_08390, partial [Sphingomicrobium sp.]|nr:hypothetical protein [Sphingomicrobium sp.]
MATRTHSGTSNRSSSNQSRSRSGGSRGAFSWGERAGPIIAAAIGGAAIGIAANFGRKAVIQGLEASIGDWDQILASEHDEALSLFDRILETDQSQTFKRKMLFMKLCHAL